jgi:hypothetical protein
MKRLFASVLATVLFATVCNLSQFFPAPTLAAPTSPAPTTPPVDTSVPLPSVTTEIIPTATSEFTFTPSVPPTLAPSPTLPPSATPATPTITPLTMDANCRFGPGTTYLSIGGLRVGETAPILGTNADHTWWQIQTPRELPGSLCWIRYTVVTASGDLSLVPVVPTPGGQVTDVLISVAAAVIHGTCGMPNLNSFMLSITTNGPATVVWHLQIFNGDGTVRSTTADSSLVFASYATQTFDPGGPYHTDCGSFYIKGIVTSPNAKSSRADWSVVSP